MRIIQIIQSEKSVGSVGDQQRIKTDYTDKNFDYELCELYELNNMRYL